MGKSTNTAKIDVHGIRKKLGINQVTFWANIGVTQSGGSRYENGRNMPKPVRMLFQLVYTGSLSFATTRLAAMRRGTTDPLPDALPEEPTA